MGLSKSLLEVSVACLRGILLDAVKPRIIHINRSRTILSNFHNYTFIAFAWPCFSMCCRRSEVDLVVLRPVTRCRGG